jgi:histone acetyltransferase 1
LGEKFRPTFTHQCFDGEWIRGYQPASCALVEDYKHPSYDNHALASQELMIDVALSPSCGECRLINVHQIEKQRVVLEPQSNKRQRVDDPNSSFDIIANENDTNGSATKEEYSKQVVTPMPEAEILERISRALPRCTEEAVDDGFLLKPIGTVLTEYTARGNRFCLAMANGQEAVDFHNQVQKLAMFFIETADEVDVADESQGYWKVLYLFRKHDINKFSLVGYMTLFHFQALFRKPVKGTVVRVCQALILPIYQKSGHGIKLMHAAHDYAQGTLKLTGFPSDIVEINVEDPAPAFTVLRSRVDYERYLKCGNDWFGDIENVKDPGCFEPLSDAKVVEVATRAKITIQQVQIVYEMKKLQGLNDYVTDVVSDKEELEKRYRLMIKKRLKKANKDSLACLDNKQEMKDYLGKWFDRDYAHRQRALVGCKRPASLATHSAEHPLT